jgi:hypothetical protein
MTTTEHEQELQRGACEEWGCGSNHNEVLALTA